VIPEATLEETEHGLVPIGEGWFVLNALDARCGYAEGRGGFIDLEGEQDFAEVGFNLFVLGPGEPIGMYHWEADQEDFLVLAGEALLIVEGEERPLRQWDFVHCPVGTKHIILGAGEGLCAVLAVGARAHQDKPGWGGYVVDDLALAHDAGVTADTEDPHVAYAHVPKRQYTSYRDGWLPSS
jgi:uncharacterized cupin superfamily protein